MNESDEEHLRSLGLSDEGIQTFCESIDDSLDPDEAFRLLCLYFKLQPSDAAWLRRYLEESAPL